jgi:hypothetical protein
MADVFENLLSEQSAEGRRSLGITGGAEASLFAAEGQQPLCSTGIAEDPGEASRSWYRAVARALRGR